MNRWLWVLQVVFGAYFVFFGIVHLVLPEGLPEQLGWMYDLSPELHATAGVAEILGGVGLILPGLTRIRPELTSLAAVGLTIVMLAAAIWHGGRGEIVQIGFNLITAAILSFIAYGRWKLAPLEGRRMLAA